MGKFVACPFYPVSQNNYYYVALFAALGSALGHVLFASAGRLVLRHSFLVELHLGPGSASAVDRCCGVCGFHGFVSDEMWYVRVDEPNTILTKTACEHLLNSLSKNMCMCNYHVCKRYSVKISRHLTDFE